MATRFPYGERAARVRQASAAVHAAALARKWNSDGGRRHTDPSILEWERCVEAFWASMREVLPEAFWTSIEQVQSGDPAGAELLIEFLEADPYYFRSGYLKADVLRWLGRIPLDEAQKGRLRTVVLNVIPLGWRREFRRYCAFAKRLDSPTFRHDLAALAASKDTDTSNRARRMLNALDGLPSKWRGWPSQIAAFARREARRDLEGEKP